MRSCGLSASAQRWVDELCDAWAVSYCDRWRYAPGVEAPAMHARVVNPRRQWLTESDVSDAEVRRMAERIHAAIDALPEDARRVLTRWAWENHYNRGVIRHVERTESGTTVRVFRSSTVTSEQVDAAKAVLAGLLPRFGVAVAD